MQNSLKTSDVYSKMLELLSDRGKWCKGEPYSGKARCITAAYYDAREVLGVTEPPFVGLHRLRCLIPKTSTWAGRGQSRLDTTLDDYNDAPDTTLAHIRDLIIVARMRAREYERDHGQ